MSIEPNLYGLSAEQRANVLAGMFRDSFRGDAEFYKADHRDGIPWDEAPLPRRWHKCTAWSAEWFGFSQVVHCACGAAMENIVREWSGKNARRKGRATV